MTLGDHTYLGPKGTYIVDEVDAIFFVNYYRTPEILLITNEVGLQIERKVQYHKIQLHSNNSIHKTTYTIR